MPVRSFGATAIGLATAMALVTTLCTCGGRLAPMPLNPVTDADVILDRMQSRKATFNALSVTARMELYSKNGVAKGRVTLLVDRSGRLRADAWTPSSDLIVSMKADRHTFDYFERGADACLSGVPCTRNLDRVLPLGLSLVDATAALFGFPPVLTPATPWSIRFDRTLGAYHLACGLEDGARQHLWIRDDGTPLRAEVIGINGLVYRAEFGDFEGTRSLPRYLRFVTPRNDTDFTIRYRSWDLVPDISDEDWVFECPQGLRTIPLPCEEEP